MYVEGGAVVSGYSARLVGVALRDLARRGYFDQVPPDQRAELLTLISEVERAGQAWRAAALPIDGSGEAAGAEIASRSVMSAEAAGVVMGVSARRVRQLAGRLGGHKAGGRWWFDHDAVLAELERRKER